MNFTYEKDEPETRECVAYITNAGALRMKIDDGVTVFFQDDTPYHGCHFNPDEAVRKFYAGDSVTITF